MNEQELLDLLARLGIKNAPHPQEQWTPAAGWGTVDNSVQPRGTTPGQIAFDRTSEARVQFPRVEEPLLKVFTKPQLAEVDRYSQGYAVGEMAPGGKVGGALLAAPMALGALLLSGANEADKAVTGGRVAYGVTGNSEFLPDESTSPASLKNVTAFPKGVMRGAMSRFGDVTGDDDQLLVKAIMRLMPAFAR